MPAKVQVRGSRPSPSFAELSAELQQIGRATGTTGVLGIQKGVRAPNKVCAKDTLGEWVNAVMKVVPHLTSDGINQALAILDSATENAQQVKDLDRIIAAIGNPHSGKSDGMYSLNATAKSMRGALEIYQHALLNKLHNLRLECGIAAPTGRPPVAAAMAPASGSFGGHGIDLRVHQQQQAVNAAFIEVQARLQQLNGTRQPMMNAAASASAGARQGAAVAYNMQQGTSCLALPTMPAPMPAFTQHGIAAPVFAAPRLERDAQLDTHDMGQNHRNTATLSTSLQMLSNEKPECLFIVRRINRLGFKAVRILTRHFMQYGLVEKVLVAHSTVRQGGDPTSHARRRPSSLGFVHMATKEAVLAILALGEEQDVSSSLIRVQKFERQHQNVEEGDELDFAEDDNAKAFDNRETSSYSDASTATAGTTGSVRTTSSKGSLRSPTHLGFQDVGSGSDKSGSR